MNIINKTLVPKYDVPEGDAILNISVYNTDTNSYLVGEELLNSYSVTPFKQFYDIGEVVTIVIKHKFGTALERTVTRTVSQPITNITLYTSSNIFNATGLMSLKPLRTLSFNTNETTINILNTRIPIRRELSEVSNNKLSGVSNRDTNVYSSVTGNELQYELTTETNRFSRFTLSGMLFNKINSWGSYSPGWVLPMVYTNATTADSFPTTIPSFWTSLSYIFYVDGSGANEFYEQYSKNTILRDIPSGWDLTNITDVSYLFANPYLTLTTVPSRLTEKSFENINGLFSGVIVPETFDITVMDFSKTNKIQNVLPYYYSEYYDKLLKKLADTRPEQNNNGVINFAVPYTPEGESYRNILIGRGWTITDGGLIPRHTNFIFDHDADLVNFRAEKVSTMTKFKKTDKVTFRFSADNMTTYTREFTIENYGEQYHFIPMEEKFKNIYVSVTPQADPNDYTISFNPSEYGYYTGDVVNVTLTSSKYESKTQRVVIGTEDVNIVFELEAPYMQVNLNIRDTNGNSIPNPTIKRFVGDREFFTNRIPKNSLLSYVITHPNYAEVRGEVMIPETGTTFTHNVVMLRGNLRLELSTIAGAEIILDNIKPFYTEGDVVNAIFRMEGYMDFQKRYVFAKEDIVASDSPIDMNNGYQVEFELMSDQTLTYGLHLQKGSYKFVYIKVGDFVKEVYTTNFPNNNVDYFHGVTYSEILSGGESAIINGRVQMEVFQHISAPPGVVVAKRDSIIHKFTVLKQTNENQFTKIWVNKIPNWIKSLSQLVNYAQLMHSVQPLQSTLSEWNGETSKPIDLLGGIGLNGNVKTALTLDAINWDWNQFTHYNYLFRNSTVNLDLNQIVKVNEVFGILDGGELLDPARYDEFLIRLNNENYNFPIIMGRTKFTSEGNAAREALKLRTTVTDGGLMNPLTYEIEINTNINDVVVTMIPNKTRYNLGETVQIVGEKEGYETQTINHTVIKYIESNVVSINMEEKRYYPTIVVKDNFGVTIPNPTIVMNPNKVSYGLGEEIVITASKTNYTTVTKTITIEHLINYVEFELVSTLVPNTLIVTPIPADMYLEIEPNKPNYDIGESVIIYGEKVGYESKTIFHTIEEGENRVTIELEEVLGYSINPYVFDMSDNLLDATIIYTPNKPLYQLNEEVLITVHKEGYQTTSETIVVTDNITPAFVLVDTDSWWIRFDEPINNLNFRFISFSGFYPKYELFDYDKLLISSGELIRSGSSSNYSYYTTIPNNAYYLRVYTTTTGKVDLGGLKLFGFSTTSSATSYRNGVFSILSHPYNLNGFFVSYDSGTTSSNVFSRELARNIPYIAPFNTNIYGMYPQLAPTTFAYLGDAVNINFKYAGVRPTNTSMATLFRGTKVYSTLEYWDFSRVTNMGSFMIVHTSTNMGGFATSDLYDKLLNAWINHPERRPANPIAINFGESKYTSAGATARQELITLGFTITDGGLEA